MYFIKMFFCENIRKIARYSIQSCLTLIGFISSPDPKGQVSYCHHLASVVVVRSPSYIVNFFKNLLLWKYKTNGNQTWSESSLGCLVSKLCPVMPLHQPTWPLLLKIEHMLKLQVLGNNSKTVNNIKNLTWGKNDQHIKIYIPCNFEVNLIAHLGVIALFSSNL